MPSSLARSASEIHSDLTVTEGAGKGRRGAAGSGEPEGSVTAATIFSATCWAVGRLAVQSAGRSL